MKIDRRGLIGGGLALGLTSALDVGGLLAAPPARRSARFPELTVTGSAGTIGLRHGRAFASQVQHNVGFYLKWFKEVINLEPSRAQQLARTFIPALREHTPALLEEIDGIARGAKCSLEQILALNARTDMLVVGRRPKQRASAGGATTHQLALGEQTSSLAGGWPGCTALALVGERARRPILALGQNWDWRSDLARSTLILRVERKGAPRLVTFTEAGMVGKIGFNQHRLGVCLNFLSHDSEDPRRGVGLPVHVLLRAVMECRTLDQAYKLVAWAPRCASANFLMAQAGPKEPRALDLEWTPTALARLPMTKGALVHTNHFKDRALAPGCTSGRGRSTMNRDKVASQRVRQLAARVADPASRMRQVLRDRTGAPYAVSKTSAKDSRSQTLASIVMDLSRNKLYVAAGPPHTHAYVALKGV